MMAPPGNSPILWSVEGRSDALIDDPSSLKSVTTTSSAVATEVGSQLSSKRSGGMRRTSKSLTRPGAERVKRVFSSPKLHSVSLAMNIQLIYRQKSTYSIFTFGDCSFPGPLRAAPVVANSDTYFAGTEIEGGRGEVEISKGEYLEGRKLICPFVQSFNARRVV